MNKIVKSMIAMGFALGMANSAFSAEALKLGYLVKQPEEPWFQTEWNFADKAGKDLGFEVIKIAVPDGEKTLNAIDSLAANGAKGFVICTPDPKLGAAIMAKANSMDLKVITVDDQFVNAKGQPMEQVPLVMMAATKIGERQGQELYKEMQKRQWDVKATGVLAITADELDTARQERDEATHRPYTSRYIGSLVSDFHRNLLKGGIYIYPSGTNSPNGKLRLLYECNPMAFLVEQAGGKASDGFGRIMDIQPTALHQRTPYFVGSTRMVERAEAFMREFSAHEDPANQG